MKDAMTIKINYEGLQGSSSANILEFEEQWLESCRRDRAERRVRMEEKKERKRRRKKRKRRER